MLFHNNLSLSLTKLLSFYTNSNPDTPPVVLTHEIALKPDGTPTALPGRFISEEEINQFHDLLTKTTSAWAVVPKRLIAHRNQSYLWWSPSKKRKMYFHTASPELNALNGHEFFQPNVLFKAEGRTLHAWALSKSKRPTLRTTLHRIPLYNISETGLVCMPQQTPNFTPESIEEQFWNSPYTHANSAGKTIFNSSLSYPEYLTTLCTHSFPTDTLLPSTITLKDILK
jgi:PRTRC genetic system protein B